MSWWLRTFVVSLLFVSIEAANRCRYRELNRPPLLEVRRPRICRGAGSFIGDDYWSSIGYDGQIRDGRSRADFLIFDQISDGYIAYWITRTKYGSTHYEAFGHAFVRNDGRICAWFVGLHKELVEVCGGFRILSRNRYNPAEPLPFEWVLASPYATSKDTLGFHNHRIAKYSWEGENYYGDARLQDKNFQGVSPKSEEFIEVTNSFDFERKIWLLRRKNENGSQLPKPQPSEPENLEFRYADPHTQEEQLYHLSRGNRYDPAYYQPRGDPRYERPHLYQIDHRSKNDDTLSGRASSQDVSGYPYEQAAVQVSGDNEGWHAVGESRPVGKGAVPSEGRAPVASDVREGQYLDAYGNPRLGNASSSIGGGVAPSQIGHGVHPNGQQPVSSQQSDSVPLASDVQPGYYRDHYGRQVPIGSENLDAYGRPIGDGAVPSAGRIGQGVQPNQQEVNSFPNGPVGQGTPSGSHLAKLHRPTIVKDEYGTIYKSVHTDGQTYYIPDPNQNRVIPDPRLVSNPRNLDNEQWRRQQEHMRIAEQERQLQEQAVRDHWAKNQEKKQEMSQQIPEPVPFEKDDDAVEQPEKLPPLRENPEETAENEDDV